MSSFAEARRLGPSGRLAPVAGRPVCLAGPKAIEPLSLGGPVCNPKKFNRPKKEPKKDSKLLILVDDAPKKRSWKDLQFFQPV